ncbi:nitroreductase family protein [Saccharothrix violaceirubra]|uniref:Nitroreductase n=1 Tax=Saccharothrix violaceirubra TaxID=413306 RepID=A0A7W7T5K9_9PSEU|nr:nitroreductase [Saccharothrix violaceirubra]MBB4965700.1 nitroreductase [Saccharothrix violaceirubra]
MTTVTETLGLTPDQTTDVLRAATLAPSVHNTQPWRFRLRPDRIELYPDLSRRLPATDPDDRELDLSCGAALFNLRLALRGHGVKPLVTLLPGSEAPGAAATIRLGGHRALDPETAELLDAIPHRRTNRKPFRDAAVPTTHRHALVRAAERERCWLHVVTRDERPRVQALMTKAYDLQIHDPRVDAELLTWTHDGIPPESRGHRPAGQDEWRFRDFRADDRPPGKDYEADPLVVVLCSFHDGRLAALQAGQALQRVLLTATAYGMSASFLSQVVEVAPVRDELRRALGGALIPQTVLRIGFGSPVPATPRRPVADLVHDDPED